jgi:acyl carrier protein
MNELEIRQRLFEIIHRIAPEADLEGLDPTENLREALDIDSFDFLNVIIALHEKLGMNVPESDYGKVSTLSGMINYLTRTLARALPNNS